MPIIVGTPPTVLSATSSDGVVTAASVAAWASVGVTVDWGAANPMPWQTTVTRTNPDGSKQVVRSGDLMFTPGGDGYAYDHEAPLDGTFSYVATGYDYNGVLVKTSTTATLTLPVAASPSCWVKAPGNPSRSLTLPGSLKWTSKGRTTRFDIPGRPTPIVWTDVLAARTGTLTLVATTAAQIGKVRAVVAESPLLIQFPSDLAVVDMFAVVESVEEAPAGPRRQAVSTFTVALTEVDRPSTVGVPLRIPNWTNDIVATQYATYAAFDAAFPTYVAQSKGP